MKRYFLITLALFLVISAFAKDLKLDVMFTNDIHGGIAREKATFMNPEFPPALGGGASHATLIKHVRSLESEQRANLLLDAGDFFQGKPIGNKTNGKAILRYFNAVKYDALTLGNHDFDNSEATLINTLKIANFPILSCNTVIKGTDTLVDYVEPYIIIEKMGIKFGIIGVTTIDTKLMAFPENIKNIDFLDEIEALNKYVPLVRDGEGADIIIVLGHMGLPYSPQASYDKRYPNDIQTTNYSKYYGWDTQEIIHNVEGIDFFIGGHIHKGFKEPWEDPITHTLAVQGYAFASNLGWLTLTIDSETKSISGYELPSNYSGMSITTMEEEFPLDPEIHAMIDGERAIAEKGMDDIIGMAENDLNRMTVDAQSPMGNVVTDAMLTQANADFAFINLGGIRAAIQPGPVTYRDVFSVMPFDNELVSFRCDGRMLRRIIEYRVSGGHAGCYVAGVEVIYSRKRDDFDRLTKLLINGEPWSPDKMYTIATTDFLLEGNAGLGFLRKIPEENTYRSGVTLRDAIVNYFKENSPITTGLDKRWERNDDSQQESYLVKQPRK